eukprot:8411629-Ditylum_brightwellii.AAC.1
MNRRLSDGVRAIMLHTKRKQPDVITSILWQLCYKCVEKTYKLLDHNSKGKSHVEVFLEHIEELIAANFHTWVCPVFVLDDGMKTSHFVGPSKWDPRDRAGVYL